MKIDLGIRVTTIDGRETTLEEYRGRVLLIVNTASLCGFTPQYAGLQKLWTEHRSNGLTVLGFPCNQFRGQEPDSNEAIAGFCSRNFGVDFPLFARIEVNGPGAHPLFRQLERGARGILGTTAIKWNFTKFLVERDGTIARRFAPTTRPEKLENAIREALARGVA